MERCSWAEKNELEREYHDLEWGKPLYDDNKLFEQLILESMQAGLSWSTIIKKRATMRQAFDQFDAVKIAAYGSEKIDELLENPGIIRHRGKIEAMINNAQKYLQIKAQYPSFSEYIWGLANHQIINNQWQTLEEIPASTDLSIKISKQLKKDGFKFLGPTSVYAFMQSVGMVNDHLVSCSFK